MAAGKKKKKKPKPGKLQVTQDEPPSAPQISLALVASLIAQGSIDLDEPFQDGPPMLIAAAIIDQPDICAYLIDHGAGLMRTHGDDHATALHYAAAQGAAGAVRYLADTMGPLKLDTPNKAGFTALHKAAVFGRVEVAQALFERQADPNARTVSGSTALYFAAQNGHCDLIRMMASVPGLNVNATNKFGISACMISASKGKTEALSILASAGAELGAQDKEGVSALHYAASEGHIDAVSVLLCNNVPCDAELLAAQGRVTPALQAGCCGYAHVLRLLLMAKANACSRISQPCSPDHGNTIAIKAAQAGHYRVLQVLHELAPQSLTLCNAQGQTALQVAQDHKSVRCVQFLGAIDIDLSATDRRWDRSVDSIVQELEGPGKQRQPRRASSSLLSLEEKEEPPEPVRERKWVNIWDQHVCHRSVEDLEHEWGSVGTKLGTQVWRIDNRWNAGDVAPAFRVQRCSTNRSQLLARGSVLLLRTHRPRRDGWCKVKLGAGNKSGDRPALGHEIFFWFGSESAIDTRGASALKAAELDKLLGGACTHHRELQGKESRSFLQLIDQADASEDQMCYSPVVKRSKGLRARPDPIQVEFEPRLLLVQAGAEVEELPAEWKSLGAGKVFVLDIGMSIFHFQGANAKPVEKVAGNTVAAGLRDDPSRRACAGNSVGEKPTLVVIDEEDLETRAHDIDVIAFCNTLGQWPPMPLHGDETETVKNGSVMSVFLERYWPKPVSDVSQPVEAAMAEGLRSGAKRRVKTDGVLWLVCSQVTRGGGRNFYLEPQKQGRPCVLESSQCYVCLDQKSPAAVLYYWIGADAPALARSAAALLGTEAGRMWSGVHNDLHRSKLEVGCVTDARSCRHRRVEQDDECQGFADLMLRHSWLEDSLRAGNGPLGVPQCSLPSQLLQVRGEERHVFVRQVPLVWSSLTKGSFFVLDSAECVFQFQGQHANPWEKYYGNQICSKICSERRGKKPALCVLDEVDLTTLAQDARVLSFRRILGDPSLDPVGPADESDLLLNDGLLHREVAAFGDAVRAAVQAQQPLVEQALEDLQALATLTWGDSATVRLFGSRVAELALQSSDLDLVVCVQYSSQSRLTVPGMARMLAWELRSSDFVQHQTVMAIDTASVPVVKAKTISQIQIDVSFCLETSTDTPDPETREHIGVAMTELLQLEVQRRPEIVAVVLVLKQLLLEQGMHEAYTGGLSSSNLILLLVVFMDSRPAVEEPLDLGAVLIDFLEHYAFFDLNTHAICLTNGFVLRSPASHTSPLVVSSPFDPTVNLASAAFAMPSVARMFKDAYYALTRAKCRFLAATPSLSEADSRLRRILSGQGNPVNLRPSPVKCGPRGAPCASPGCIDSWQGGPWEPAEEYLSALTNRSNQESNNTVPIALFGAAAEAERGIVSGASLETHVQI